MCRLLGLLVYTNINEFININNNASTCQGVTLSLRVCLLLFDKQLFMCSEIPLAFGLKVWGQ